MPIRISGLAHRMDNYPSREGDDMHLTERRWFAIRTRSKHEKMAARELKRSGIEYYLPLRQKVAHYKGRKNVTTTEIPLLSGYLFVFIHQREELTVQKADHVSSFVRLGKQRLRVKEAELDLLRKISTDRDLDWQTIDDAFAFAEGMPVEIIRGPLTGV
ncbi:MAG: transcription termination/antitermination NusG family protein, partial [Bacteroidota bacterium]